MVGTVSIKASVSKGDPTGTTREADLWYYTSDKAAVRQTLGGWYWHERKPDAESAKLHKQFLGSARPVSERRTILYRQLTCRTIITHSNCRAQKLADFW